MRAAAARRFCTAPMMSYSHKHARYFWRLLCPPALIYTEMLSAEALCRRERAHLLEAGAPPPLVALQLGGNTPARLAQAAVIGEDAGYAEINLNCGCPSPRVKKGAFGACLMRTPQRVADCVAAMKQAVRLPITVKCRIAVDDMDAETGLQNFTATVAAAGCDALIVHARRAWLNGLNPAQNRSVPPLDYARVRRLKADFPDLPIVLNGGLETLDAAADALEAGMDGVMLGRAVCREPYLLAAAARRFFAVAAPSKAEVLEAMRRYVESVPPRERRWALSTLTGLYRGEANASRYRRALAAGEWIPPLPAAASAAAAA